MKLLKATIRKSKLLMLFFLSALFITSCYNDYGLNTEDYDVVYTKYDPNTNFAAFKTFVMPDSVFHLIGDNSDDNISRQFDALILHRVAENMENRGFERVNSLDSADVVVVVSVSNDTYSGAIYYPPSWGYPGWGWDYPPYWGDVTYYEYNTGTLYIQFADKRNIDGQNILYTNWLAIANGLLSSNIIQTQNRIEKAINQAFAQSPYLRTN